ncbi:hypothetical protein AYO47_05290 [Planctomyces sp. SCGC AG-212-M04]|nr:hypothetical protein AYO47_05290 [Planctomyces sp. SCGC AG-212-M04]
MAGDLTTDWNIAHVASGDGPSATWTSEEQTRISSQPGGAALLGEIVGAVAASIAADRADSIRVVSPEISAGPPSPLDRRCHHSFALWAQFDKGIWRVQQFLGLDRKDGNGPGSAIGQTPDDRENAEIVVLDDAGLGFRDVPESWPTAVRDGQPRWIVLEMACPVAQGRLWDALLRDHAERLIVVMTTDDLRRTEVQISQRLSWERTAQDVLWELTHNPRVNGLSRCAHVVVSFGTSGAVLLSRGSNGLSGTLLSEPTVMETGWERPDGGRMIGSTATLTAAIARQLLLEPETPDLSAAVQSGIAGMRRLYSVGYGTGTACELRFPRESVIAELATPSAKLSAAAIEDPVRFLTDRGGGSQRPQRSRLWTILEDRYSDQIDSIAERIVLEGLDATLTQVPRAHIGALVTVDRQEIESLRSVQNLIGEYCRHPQKRPLSMAAFGPPGSGKSFGVEQVANSVRPGEIRTLTFNLSQFAAPDELHGAFHQVRDVGLGGRIPLVFWDEFDTALDGRPLGWLRYFLAPMQDGSFQQGEITHPIGRSIFVFAGGTSERFESFGGDLPADQQRGAKLPDFVSRLKGALNVLGPNPTSEQGAQDPFHLIRRAILLRSLFERNAPHLLAKQDGQKRLNIDRGVLRALLKTRRYRHGIRSMESVIAMSLLAGTSTFERSSLPAQSQLEIHVDSLDFLSIVQEIVLDDSLTERLAEAAHEVYCDGKRRDGWTWGPEKSETKRTHPQLVPYDKLPEDLKESNRVTVRAIPQKLARAGYVMIPARSDEMPLEFPGDDLEKLAEFEHDLWRRARIAAGFSPGTPTPENPKLNEYLVDWSEVPESIKQIDRDLVRGIPRILARAGYAVVKRASA